MIFNRTYHARARHGAMVSAGEVLDELVERAVRRRRTKRSSGNLQGGLQLELFVDQPVPRDPDRPLLDLMPEAYNLKASGRKPKL